MLKTLALLILATVVSAAEFKTADDAFKAADAAIAVLQADEEQGKVEDVVVPQAKILRDAVRYFQANADASYTDEECEHIALVNKSLHNARQRMPMAVMVKFNSSDKAPKAKTVAKK